MPMPVRQWPPTAYLICARHGRLHVEGVEDPHTHPEAPSDKILSDFFCPNCLRL